MKKIFALFITFLVFSVLFVSIAYAQENRRIVVLPKNETVNGDYFGAGQSVTVSGTVNGDVYAAGGNIIIDGEVNGDVLAAGGTITITGTVRDNVRIAGGSISILGNIGRNVTVGGGNITLSPNAKVGGSFVGGGGSFTINGPIGRDIRIGGGSVVIASSVGGDLMAGVGSLSFSPSARIGKNLEYWSSEKANFPSGTSISGRTIFHQTLQKQRGKHVVTTLSGFTVTLKVVSFVIALVLGLIFLKMIPLFMMQAVGTVKNDSWKALLTGFLTLLATPVLVLLLLFTIIGIPVAITVLFFFILLTYLAKIIVSIAIGQKLWVYISKKESLGLAFVVGLFVYYAVTLIPFIGGVAGFLVMLFGMGALLLQKYRLYTSLRLKKLI